MSIKGFNINGNIERYDYASLENKPDIPDKNFYSPDGSKWNISVDNDGNVVATKIIEEIPATSIILSENILSFDSSANKTLTATLVPSNSTDVVVWTSSDESIAVASNGVVTPISNGSATITAKAGNVSATCEITVDIESGEVTTYTITRNITNAIGFDDATVIGEGSELLECYISDDECTMNGATATVTMGGEDITETAWDNGVVNIAEVTGDVVITLNAVKIDFVIPPITDFSYEIYENTKLKVTTYNGTEKAIELPTKAEIDGKTYTFYPYGLNVGSSVEHLKIPETMTYLIASVSNINGDRSVLRTIDNYSPNIWFAPSNGNSPYVRLEKANKKANYQGCAGIRTLENVVYPETVTSLQNGNNNEGVYMNMTGLVDGGTIPSHITDLLRAFYGCTNLRKIRVETVADGTSASGGAFYQTFYGVSELDIELYVSGGLWKCLRSDPSLKWNYIGIDQDIDRVVCFGDSLTEATYPTEIRRLLPQNVTTHNCGQGGYTSEQIYQRMISDPYCRRLKDDIIVIWHGTNGYGTDGSDGVTAKMVEALDGNERYVLIPPTAQGVGDTVYESWVATYGAEHVLSISDWFEKNGYTISSYLTDGTHFNSEGYALVAQAVYEKVQQYL